MATMGVYVRDLLLGQVRLYTKHFPLNYLVYCSYLSFFLSFLTSLRHRHDKLCVYTVAVGISLVFNHGNAALLIHGWKILLRVVYRV